VNVKCKHQNIDITEITLRRKTHHFVEGSRVETSAYCGPLPRQFDVHCKDCGLEKSYRLGPGQRISPKWLYDYVEGTKK
jgi:hypothetical protein